MDPQVRTELNRIDELLAILQVRANAAPERFQVVRGVVLAAGMAVVAAGITVTALTRVFVVSQAVITGSVNVGTFAHLVASNVVGAPGVGAVTINLLGDDGAVDADAAGTIALLLVG